MKGFVGGALYHALAVVAAKVAEMRLYALRRGNAYPHGAHGLRGRAATPVVATA